MPVWPLMAVPDDNAAAAVAKPAGGQGTVLKVLLAISVSHMLNDTIQSLLPALYPLLKAAFKLNFAQVGLIIPRTSHVRLLMLLIMPDPRPVRRSAAVPRLLRRGPLPT